MGPSIEQACVPQTHYSLVDNCHSKQFAFTFPTFLPIRSFLSHLRSSIAMVQRLGRPWRSDTVIAVSLCGMYFKSLLENWNANHGELAKLLARRKQILLGKASRNGFQTPWNLLVACADESAHNCCSTSEVGSGDLKKRTTVSHTCPKLWKQCMRDEVKKSYFGDPSWKMHF